jgi:hypothetical protein
VASAAAAKIVIPSTTIQSMAMPRRSRDGSPTYPPVDSREDDTEFEILCQNSDVAISVPQTSKFQDVRIKEKTYSPVKTMHAALADV